jgi:hypothetical protein
VALAAGVGVAEGAAVGVAAGAGVALAAGAGVGEAAVPAPRTVAPLPVTWMLTVPVVAYWPSDKITVMVAMPAVREPSAFLIGRQLTTWPEVPLSRPLVALQLYCSGRPLGALATTVKVTWPLASTVVTLGVMECSTGSRPVLVVTVVSG